MIIRRANPNVDLDVASNREFLREGSATEVPRALYRPLFLRETPTVMTTLVSARLVKYAANTFLAIKITIINEIADLCEKLGADVQDIARGIGLDGRIGATFLHAGPGYGGSCFPKDTMALAQTAKRAAVT